MPARTNKDAHLSIDLKKLLHILLHKLLLNGKIMSNKNNVLGGSPVGGEALPLRHFSEK
jgi:hypothetical protein